MSGTQHPSRFSDKFKQRLLRRLRRSNTDTPLSSESPPTTDPQRTPSTASLPPPSRPEALENPQTEISGQKSDETAQPVLTDHDEHQFISDTPDMANATTAAPQTNGVNGANGYFSPPSSPSIRFGGSARGNARGRSGNYSASRGMTNGSDMVYVVRDTATALKRKSASELGAGVAQTASNIGFINLVEWIRAERLQSLPHRGSTYDTVLIRALYFAERLHGFESALNGHAAESEQAAQLGYGHVKLLLELGHENSQALDKAFGFLYRCSSAVSALLARAEVMSLSSDIYEQLCAIYSDLLTVVVDFAVHFYKKVHGSAEGSESLDIYETFGDSIDSFRQRREAITKAIWRDQLSKDGGFDEGVDVDTLSRWLAPEDKVLATLALDYTLIADNITEFTCLWFHDDLSKFVKSNDHSLLIKGASGSGKTTLAASLTERLQRPIARKSYNTVFCSIGAGQSQATSLSVVKTLLYQLLAIRVGNLHLYHAIARTFEQARATADAVEYEDLLWSAFEHALRTPLERSNDTVLVVDGIDELAEGPSAGQGLLQRLVYAVDQGKGVKMIALAQNASLPSGTRGTQRSIAPDETAGDVYEVILHSLARNREFRKQPGRDQETMTTRLRDASNGSILWATLVCEVLRLESSDLVKAVNTWADSKASIEDLALKLVTTLQPSEEAKTLLTWMVHSARPLTFREIESVFNLNVQNGTRSDRRVDSQTAVESLAPLVNIQEDIVRIRHPALQAALSSLIKQRKITTPVKDSPTDLLLRLWTYAKVSLPEKGAPTLDGSDRSVVEQSFGRNPFLEYVIRYWPWHLQQVTPKPDDLKITPEMTKVFPQSTVVPILEWFCWDEQFPGAKEVEYHQMAGTIRQKVLTREHPAVLQSYINVANYLENVDRPKASSFYYAISTIARQIFTVSHPLVVECSNRFLRLTNTETATTRTQSVTYREEILMLLIASYERTQDTTTLTRTRERLLQLYTSINEQEKASELRKTIRGAEENTRELETRTQGGRTTDESLRVKLGRTKSGQDLQSYEDGIFVDEDDDEEAAMQVLDLAQADAILKQIETYKQQQDYARAEQTYVELWQRLSETCRRSMSTDWHMKKIQTVQSYAQYLATQKRSMEAASLTTSLSREYESHQLAYSEGIVNQLTESARFLKSVGEYTAALAIFKHASSFYRSVKKEDSRSLSSIEEEMTVVSTQALREATKDSKAMASSSESTQQDMFQVLISNKSRAMDQTTMSLAKSLSAKYIEQRSYSEAVSVIQQTLSKTWSSFLIGSVNEVSLASSYQQESIQLIEQLAEVYIRQRRFDQAEDIYLRLFRAALLNPKDQQLLERAKSLLLGFYQTRGHPDKAIHVYQELLAMYRRTLGPDHETTVTVLYELASRCRAHARSHPYWIEYYQQITTALNKDSTTVHIRAMDAAMIVAESYWEERRYSDAVVAYGLIWNTFVHKTKDFKSFSDAAYVRSLYERYYQSLEGTKADFEVLLNTTKQYRDTTRAAFGASSELAIEATVSLARVCQQSESHMSESIALYEEASSHASKSQSLSQSASFNSAELSQTLKTLYRKRVTSSSEASASSETNARAMSMYQENLTENKSRYSYSHEATLSSLREFSMLSVKQKKTEQATKELQTAVIDIVQKEQSSQKMYESATSLVQTYQAAGLVQECTQLVDELHYQLISRQKSSKASFSVVESSSASLYFLATMEYHLRKDVSITMSEIMANLSAEYIFYSRTMEMVNSKVSLDKLLLTASGARYLLQQHNRTALVANIDREVVDAFVQRDVGNMHLLSKQTSPRHFIVGIMTYIGNKTITDFVQTVIRASNRTLKSLVDDGKFADAHDVANITFQYARYRNGYRGPKGISRGFDLASYLDGRGEARCPDPELRKKLLSLSNSIVKEVLKICQGQKIDLARVPLKELNELIALLGEQQDYETLESLLGTLWSTREAQKTWPADILLNLGRRLVCARYLAGHPIKALRLGEDVAYNLRRVYGATHPTTLSTYQLLAELHTATAQSYQKESGTNKAATGMATEHFRKALLVYEDLLRWQLSASTGGEVGADDDDDDDTAASILAEHGVDPSPPGQNGAVNGHDANGAEGVDAAKLKTHIYLLKLASQRLAGQWPKSYDTYTRLNADLFRVFPEQLKGVEGIEKWAPKKFELGKAESNEGVFGREGNSWEILTAA